MSSEPQLHGEVEKPGSRALVVVLEKGRSDRDDLFDRDDRCLGGPIVRWQSSPYRALQQESAAKTAAYPGIQPQLTRVAASSQSIHVAQRLLRWAMAPAKWPLYFRGP